MMSYIAISDISWDQTTEFTVHVTEAIHSTGACASTRHRMLPGRRRRARVGFGARVPIRWHINR